MTRGRLLRSRSDVLALAALTAVALAGACKRVDPNQLVIERATWSAADGRASLDVTKRIAGLVKHNALSIEATPRLLGDPAPFMLKELRVEWRKGKVVGRKFAPEGKSLTIAADERPVPIRVVVRKAVYGDLEAGKVIDVTQKVDGLLDDNVLSFTPSDRLFGDPAAGQPKQLRVDYTLDGAPKSKTGDQDVPFSVSTAKP